MKRLYILCITFLLTFNAFFIGLGATCSSLITYAEDSPTELIDVETKAFSHLISAFTRMGIHFYKAGQEVYPTAQICYKVINGFANSPYNIDSYTATQMIDILANGGSWAKQVDENIYSLTTTPAFNYLLNQFQNYINTDETFRPDYRGMIEIPTHGSVTGTDGNKYGLFYFRTGTDFDWGSCLPLGSQGYSIASSESNGTVSTPWGVENAYYRSYSNVRKLVTYVKSISSSNAGENILLSYYYAGDQAGRIINIGSPCLFIKSLSYDHNIYKGTVYRVNGVYHLGEIGVYEERSVEVPAGAISLRNLSDATDIPSEDSPTGGSPNLRQPTIIYTPSDPSTYPDPESDVFQEVTNNYYIDNSNHSVTNNNTINNIIYENPQNVKPVDDPDAPEPDDPEPENPNNPAITPADPDAGGNQGTDTIGGGGSTDNPLDLDGTIDFPNFNFNLPNINWSIDGLSEKFPFSIPFDLYAMYTVLDAEPETPQIQGHLDLHFVDWQFDYNLHQFDTVASILRTMEFIGFAIGLILITRRLIKG